jgi:hypothetical protein
MLTAPGDSTDVPGCADVEAIVFDGHETWADKEKVVNVDRRLLPRQVRTRR